jgi:basic membrane protein A
MKYLDRASYDMIKDELAGTFPGGQILRLDAKNDGIGIPEENPNLSQAAKDAATKALENLKSGKITVAATGDGLIK